MYRNADIDTTKIPEIVDKYAGKLKFIPEANPYFIYYNDKKINDMEVYRKVLQEIIEDISSLDNSLADN